MTNLTYVTSYLKIYDNNFDTNRTFEKRLEHFLLFAEAGLNICLYTCDNFYNQLTNILEKYPNIKVYNVSSINKLEFYKLYNKGSSQRTIPTQRHHLKDTVSYMLLMNAKIEFVNMAILTNPFNSNYFAWIDFNLPYIFKNVNTSISTLQKYSNTNFISSFIAMPGCWNKHNFDINYLSNIVAWRFCGGFFIGDKDSLLNFYNISINNFNKFLDLTKSLVWEVNYWLWLELENYFTPIWFLADHNDTIINIPGDLIIK